MRCDLRIPAEDLFMFKYKHNPTRVRRILSKTLTIRDEVYRKLVNVKGKDESFSELFERLVDMQSSSNTLKAIRGAIELSSQEKKDLLESISKQRTERRGS